MATTIIDIFEERVNASGAAVAIRGLNQPAGMTWREWFDASERFAASLVEWGVQPGDRCALIANTRPEWVVVDIGIMMAGAVSVPLYPSSPAIAVQAILKDAQPSVVVVEDPVQLQKVLSCLDDIPTLKRVVYLDHECVFRTPAADGKRQLHVQELQTGKLDVRAFEQLDGEGRRALVDTPKLVSKRRRALRPEDVASVVYTSGTSREPLGVKLTHDNFLAEVQALTSLNLLTAQDAQILFLPLAHIFARVLYITAIGYGIETTYMHELHRLKEAWQSVQPTFFAGVPHVFERIREQFESEIRNNRLAARWYDSSQHRPSRPQTPLARLTKITDTVVAAALSQSFKETFGGRLRFLISGGAPLPVSVSEFFEKFGILVLEGYGLTEVTAVATVNLPDEHRVGSVGRPLPGVEVTLDEDGEILIRGRSVMPGYLNRDDLTRAAIDPQGWFRTGDLGEYDRDGFLHITGRKKDIIVTSGGKNIAPAPIEAALRNHPLVSSAIIFADQRPYVVALLGVPPKALAETAKSMGTTPQDLLKSTWLKEQLTTHVQAVNQPLAPFEQIRKFDILEDDLSVGDELTPTNKVRRHRVFEKYQDRIDTIYRTGPRL